MTPALTLADFGRGKWEVLPDSSSPYGEVVDLTTGKVYENDSPGWIRSKALIFSGCGVWGMPWNTLDTTFCVVSRCLRLLSCYRFSEVKGAKSINAGKDVVRIIGAVPFCLATQCMLCVAVVYPDRDVKKLIHTLDLIQFDGDLTVAPCYHHTRVLPLAPPKQVEMTEQRPVTNEKLSTTVTIKLPPVSDLSVTEALPLDTQRSETKEAEQSQIGIV